MKHHEEVRDSKQLKMVRVIAEIEEGFACAVIDKKVRGKTGLCDVRLVIPTGHRLGYEEENSRQEKRDTIEVHNSVGRLRFCRCYRIPVL